MKTIDARGLSCPEPVMLTAQTIKQGESEFVVLADNNVAKENITRYAQNNSYGVEVKEDNEEYTLHLVRE